MTDEPHTIIVPAGHAAYIYPVREQAQVHITSRPELLGGEPCFMGTRIPAALIKALMSGNDALTAERVAYFYPSLTGLDLDGWLAHV